MSELTLKAIEQLLDTKLDEKLKPIKTGMASLATGEELKAVSTKVDTLQETVNSHTSTLAAIAKNTKTWDTELPVLQHQLQRMEDWIKQAALKLGVDYKP